MDMAIVTPVTISRPPRKSVQPATGPDTRSIPFTGTCRPSSGQPIRNPVFCPLTVHPGNSECASGEKLSQKNGNKTTIIPIRKEKKPDIFIKKNNRQNGFIAVRKNRTCPKIPMNAPAPSIFSRQYTFTSSKQIKQEIRPHP